MFAKRYQLILSVMLVVLAMLVTLSSVVFAGRIHVYEGPEFYTGKVCADGAVFGSWGGLFDYTRFWSKGEAYAWDSADQDYADLLATGNAPFKLCVETEGIELTRGTM